MRLLRRELLLDYDPPKEEVSKLGIILDWQEPDLQYAKVMHVGTKCEWGIEVGQEVWFKRAVANKRNIEDTVYLEIHEEMILGIKEN